MLNGTIPSGATPTHRHRVLKAMHRRDTLAMMDSHRVVGYVRVSTQKQAEQGMSLEAQSEAIRVYARNNNLVLREIIVDAGISGKNLKRAGIGSIIEGLDNGTIGTVVVCKFDRLSRSLIDFFSLVEKYFNKPDRQLISINEKFDTKSPAGSLIVPLIVLFAQWERTQMGERTKMAIEHIQAQGGHHGHPPFGYDLVREGNLNKLVSNPKEQEWLARLYDLRDSGKGLTEIARYLNENGVTAKRGKPWSKHTVYGVLVRRGKIMPRTCQAGNLVHNKYAAWKIAYELRNDQRSYHFIATELTRNGYRPLKAARYTVSSVVDLLKGTTFFDNTTAYGYAATLRSKGYSLRQIASKLSAGGFKPLRGGQWYAATVANLLREGEQSSQS